jgi:GAF domain-containing protein
VEQFYVLLSQLAAELDRGALDELGAMARIAAYVRERLACSRVSFWLLAGQAGSRKMRRVLAQDADGPAQDAAVVLRDEAFSDYFDVLVRQGCYVCPDILLDSRLSAMRESYLLPHDIRASLGVAVSVNGSAWAILCCAQRGTPRQWHVGEVALVKRMANEISLRRTRREIRGAGQPAGGEEMVARLLRHNSLRQP